jgi:hypothetical protein
MLSIRDRDSKLAHSVLDDGDDLFITGSFRADEENSSTIGNSSYMEPPPKTSPISVKARSEDGSATSVASSLLFDAETVKQEKRKVPRLPFPSNLLRTRRFWPWRLNPMLLRQRHAKVLKEYQEIIEEEDSPKTDLDSATVHSIRSTRFNVATGRSMLVRQNAQVIGRPSMAQTDWDVGSSFSSDSGSTRSRRSLSCDIVRSNSGISDISHLTTDSFRSKRSDFSPSRAMYVSGPGTLLGDTQSEESDDEQDENTTPNNKFFNEGHAKHNSTEQTKLRGKDTRILQKVSEEEECEEGTTTPNTTAARKFVNRVLHRNEDGQHRATEFWELFATLSSDEWPTSPPDDFENAVRDRIFSDTDVLFERQRQRSEQQEFGFETSLASPSVNRILKDLKGKEPCSVGLSWESVRVMKEATSLNTASTRKRLMSDPQFELSFRPALDAASCQTRTRIHSDSDFTSTAELMRPSPQSRVRESPPVVSQRRRATSVSEYSSGPRKSRDEGCSERHGRSAIEAGAFEHPRSRFYSDSDITTASAAMVQTRSTLNWRVNTMATSRNRKNSDSEISTGSFGSTRSIAGLSEQTPKAKDERPAARQPLQPLSGLSSPNALSAARMIASALRPIPTPTLPLPSTQCNDYYWNDDSDSDPSSPSGEEVLWSLSMSLSLDSLDDIL